ncbi:MAG: hypothetical protein ACRC5A_08460, partial [Enterobacteriaceae bacterium]
NDHLIMITAHFPLFFLKIRHFFYRYQLVDPKDPTYNGIIASTNGVPWYRKNSGGDSTKQYQKEVLDREKSVVIHRINPVVYWVNTSSLLVA